MQKAIIVLSFVLAISQLGNISHAFDTASTSTRNYEVSISDEKSIVNDDEENDANRKKRTVVLLIPVKNSEETVNSEEEKIEEAKELMSHGHKTKRCKALIPLRKVRRISIPKYRQKYIPASTESSIDDSIENLNDKKSYFRLASMKDAKNILKSLLKSKFAKREDNDALVERVSKSQNQDSTTFVDQVSQKSGQRPKKYVCYCIEDNCGTKKSKKPSRPYSMKKPNGPHILAKYSYSTNEENQRISGHLVDEQQILGAPHNLHCPPGAVLVEESDYAERPDGRHQSQKRRPVKKCPPTIVPCESDTQSMGQPTRINIPLADDRKLNTRIYKVDRKLPYAQKLQSVIEQNASHRELPFSESEMSVNNGLGLQDYYNNQQGNLSPFGQIPMVANPIYPSPYIGYPQYPQYLQYGDGLIGNPQITVKPIDQPCEVRKKPSYVATPLGKNFIDIDECIKMFGPNFCFVSTTTISSVNGPKSGRIYEEEYEKPTIGSHWNDEIRHTTTELPHRKTTKWGYPVDRYPYDIDTDSPTYVQEIELGRENPVEGEKYLEQSDQYPQSRIKTKPGQYRVSSPQYFSGQQINKKIQSSDFSEITTSSYGVVGSKQKKPTDFDVYENFVNTKAPIYHSDPNNVEYLIPIDSRETNSNELGEFETNYQYKPTEEAMENEAPNTVSLESVTEFPRLANTGISSNWQGVNRIISPQHLEYTIEPTEKYISPSSSEDTLEEIVEYVPATHDSELSRYGTSEYRYSTQSFHQPQNKYYTKPHTIHGSLDNDAEPLESSTKSTNTIFVKMEKPWANYKTTIPTENSKGHGFQKLQKMTTVYPVADSEDHTVSTSSRTQSPNSRIDENSVPPSSSLYYSIQPEQLATNFVSKIAKTTSSPPQFVGITQSTPINDYSNSRFVSSPASGNDNRYTIPYVAIKNAAYGTTPLLRVNESREGKFTSTSYEMPNDDEEVMTVSTRPQKIEKKYTDYNLEETSSVPRYTSRMKITDVNEYSTTKKNSHPHFVGSHHSTNGERLTDKSPQQFFGSNEPTQNYISTKQNVDYLKKHVKGIKDRYTTAFPKLRNSLSDNIQTPKQYSFDTKLPEEVKNYYSGVPAENWYYTTQSGRKIASSAGQQATAEQSVQKQYVGSYHSIPDELISTSTLSALSNRPATHLETIYSPTTTEDFRTGGRQLSEMSSKYNFYSTQSQRPFVTVNHRGSIEPEDLELALSTVDDNYGTEDTTNSYTTAQSILGVSMSAETTAAKDEHPRKESHLLITTPGKYQENKDAERPLGKSLRLSGREEVTGPDMYSEEGALKNHNDFITMSSEAPIIAGNDETKGINYSTVIDEDIGKIDRSKTSDTSISNNSNYTTNNDVVAENLFQKNNTANDEFIVVTLSYGKKNDDISVTKPTTQTMNDHTRQYADQNYEKNNPLTSETVNQPSDDEIRGIFNKEEFGNPRDASSSSTSSSATPYFDNPSTFSNILKSENIVDDKSMTVKNGNDYSITNPYSHNTQKIGIQNPIEDGQKSNNHNDGNYLSSTDYDENTIVGQEERTSQKSIVSNIPSETSTSKKDSKRMNITGFPNEEEFGNSRDAFSSSTPSLATHYFENPSTFSHVLKSENIVRDEPPTKDDGNSYSKTMQYSQSTVKSAEQYPVNDRKSTDDNDGNPFSFTTFTKDSFSGIDEESTTRNNKLPEATNEAQRMTTYDKVGDTPREQNSSTNKDNNLRSNNDEIARPSNSLTETSEFRGFTSFDSLARSDLSVKTVSDASASLEATTTSTTGKIKQQDNTLRKITGSKPFASSYDVVGVVQKAITTPKGNQNNIIEPIANKNKLQSDEYTDTNDYSSIENSRTIVYSQYPHGSTSSFALKGQSFADLEDVTYSNGKYEESIRSEYDLTSKTADSAGTPLRSHSITTTGPTDILETFPAVKSASHIDEKHDDISFTNQVALKPHSFEYQVTPTFGSSTLTPATENFSYLYEPASSLTLVGNTLTSQPIADSEDVTSSGVEYDDSTIYEHELTQKDGAPVGPLHHSHSITTTERTDALKSSPDVKSVGSRYEKYSPLGSKNRIASQQHYTEYQTTSKSDSTEVIAEDDYIPDKDIHFLKTVAQRVVNTFISPKSNNAYKNGSKTPEIVGASNQGFVSKLPVLKSLFSLPEVKDMAINTVKSLISEGSGVPQDSSLGRLGDHVIESVLNGVVHDVLPEEGTTAPLSVAVDEHRYENGHWTVVPGTVASSGDNVGQQPADTITNSIQNILGRPGIGLQGARLPIVQNIIVRTVENALTKAKGVVDNSMIWDTLHSIIDRAESAGRPSHESLFTKKPLPEASHIKGSGGSMKNIPIIPITEHVFKNGQWSEKQTILGNKRKNVQPSLSSSVSTSARDDNERRSATSGYGTSIILGNKLGYSRKATDYALLGESDENRDETTAGDVIGKTDQVFIDTTDETVGATSGYRIIDDKEDLEKTPIEYYSPNSRILTYIKNHPTSELKMETTLRSLGTDEWNNHYWPLSQIRSNEFSTIDDSGEFGHSTISDSDEVSSRLPQELSLGATEKSKICKCLDEPKNDNADKVGSGLQTSTQELTSVTLDDANENYPDSSSTIYHFDADVGKHIDYTTEEYIRETNPQTSLNSRREPETESSFPASDFSSTIHHLDVTKDNDYTTEEYISNENLPTIEHNQKNAGKVENPQLAAYQSTVNYFYGEEDGQLDDDSTHGSIEVTNTSTTDRSETNSKEIQASNAEHTGSHHYTDFADKARETKTSNAHDVPAVEGPKTTVNREDRVEESSEGDSTTNRLYQKYKKKPKYYDSTQESMTSTVGLVGSAKIREESQHLQENMMGSLNSVTPKWGPTYFGKISLNGANSAVDKISDLTNTDLFYIGDGVKIPLTIRRMSDGSYALSISEKICEHFVNRKCPCCVPKEGDIVEERRQPNDIEDAECDTMSKRNSHGIASFEPTESSEYGSKSKKRYVRSTSGSDVIVTSASPVGRFIRKYNLTLNLKKDHHPVEPLITNEKASEEVVNPIKTKWLESSRGTKIANLFGNNNQIQRDDSEEQTRIIDDHTDGISKESNTIRRSDLNYDGDTNSVIRSLVNIGDVPENKRAEVVLNALDDLINSASAKNLTPIGRQSMVVPINEDSTDDVNCSEYDLNDVEDEMARYGYQKDNPILERIRYIKEKQHEHGQYKYQQNIDHQARGKMNVLKTVLHWLREVFLESKIDNKN